MLKNILLSLFLVLTVLKTAAQDVDFMTDDFNSIETWNFENENFTTSADGFIVHNSDVYGTDFIYKELKDFSLDNGTVTWKVEITTDFKNSGNNNFRFFFLANHENTDYEDFEGVGLATGVKNSLIFIRCNGKKTETLYTFQEEFSSGSFLVTRSVSGVWTVNGETVYDDNGKSYQADYLLTAFKFNKTGAKKFAFRFLEFQQVFEEKPIHYEAEIFQAKPSEIVINEIMADVSPAPFALPEKKYVEIFNTSRNAFNIKNYTFVIGQDEFVLPEMWLKAGDYLVLDDSFIKTDKLTVSGKFLALKNADGKCLDSLTYSVSLYNDDDKKSGGFSMERIDPKKNCYQQNNWKASQNLAGGTPGEKNSVYKVTSETETEIKIEKTFAVNKNQALVWFNSEILSADIDKPFAITSDKKSILVTFENDFLDGKNYELQIKKVQNFSCSLLENITENFVYQKPDYQDIVINEILFNPVTGGKRFVELYNNSDYEFSLYGLSLNSLTTEKSCTVNDFLFLPQREYVVLTADTSDIQSKYDCGGLFLQDKKFPTLDEKEGILVLKNIDNITLDSVYYSKTFHNKFLSSQEGVSLERLDFNDDNKWQSASESYGFATPGKENSRSEIFQPEPQGDYQDEITIENQLFTPLNEDKMFTLVFNFKTLETTLNISVYDEKGRFKKTLADNLVAAKNEKVSWDGLDEASNRCPTGIYIVLIKTADSFGNAKNYKKVCVIGTNN
ncbi:MAG: lamin tail domain-containing protein [Bacteroidales bacterium]|nr:lamin tail domain-containing protein [Bacteroidales bacterium]